MKLIKLQDDGKSVKEGIDDERPHKTKRNLESNGEKILLDIPFRI